MSMEPEKVFEFKEKIATLQEAIHSQHPTMPVLLRQIHTQLKADPEVVTLLDEEEIGIVVNGLKIQTKTEIAATTAKKASASTTAAVKKAIKSSGSAVDLF